MRWFFEPAPAGTFLVMAILALAAIIAIVHWTVGF
jgi:hypothetical protein